LLGTLAQVCDVRLVSTGLTARWLVHEHRDALPTEFSERCDAHRSPDGPVDELVEEARAALDPEGRAVAVLRDLANQPGETLAYDELRSRQSVSASRVSQVLGKLESFDLAARIGQRSNKRVELRPAGSVLLDTLDAEIGRQAELDETFRDTGQSSTQAVSSRAWEGPPRPGKGTPRTVAEAGPCYRTRWLPERDHAGAAATATDGGVTAVEAPVPGEDDAEERRTRYVSYDADRGEAVVAVRATGPLQYVVSVAIALASPRFFDTVLPVNRLDDVEDPPAILRDARCIGWLSEEGVEDPAVLREEIVEAGRDLAEMTTDLRYGAYEDRSRFRGDIVRTALGLAGTVVHLLDVVGVNVVRELRVPGGLDEKHLTDLARVVGISAAIQSKYGAFTIYRQLFEDREDKRRVALTPEVDAADPIGSYVGSLVVRGPDVGRFVEHLRPCLSRPAAVHDDAPEIAVEVPIVEPDRETYAETVAQMCSTKSLRATREAVTLFRTFTGDPYAVSEALHWLGAEDNPREIRLDDVRVALSRLDADRLLPDAAPTVSEVLSVLLRTTSPLTQSELAEEADVSTRSLRRHMGPLVALDLVREVDDGFRLSLPDSDDERGQRIVPEPVDDGIMTLTDLLFDVGLALVEDVSRLSEEVTIGRPVGGESRNRCPLTCRPAP
jgi:DNA-binding IscR family transcriptional regulator